MQGVDLSVARHEPDEMYHECVSLFEQQFGYKPQHVVAAPGRVNMIGEHTDYQEGFVFPMALQKKCAIAFSSKDTVGYRLHSREMKESVEFATLPDKPVHPPVWWSYIVGSMHTFCQASGAACPAGLDAAVITSVPIGGGLSSSAAVEVATATMMEVVTSKQLGLMEKARSCQRAEHEWADMPCGLMDQAISVCGQPGHAMLLDCRSTECRHYPLRLSEVNVLVIDSAARHQLNEGEYAQRKAQCQAAVEAVKKRHPNVKSLRDCTERELEEVRGEVDGTTFKRASHVVAENKRCEEFAARLTAGDWEAAGKLMYASHASLRDNFEVSTTEIDHIVELARQQQGVYGARITGGGFGGCVVVLVKTQDAVTVMDKILSEYNTFLEKEKASGNAKGVKFGVPMAFVAQASQGAHVYVHKPFH